MWWSRRKKQEVEAMQDGIDDDYDKARRAITALKDIAALEACRAVLNIVDYQQKSNIRSIINEVIRYRVQEQR